mgnify:CR=1 FL=1
MQDEPLSGTRAAAICAEIRRKYRAVADSPAGAFPYPIGRESALGLGYEEGWIESIPPEVIDRFVGVGNPFRVESPREGDRVLDLGCGCGLDSFVASRLVGSRGAATGVDLTPEMLEIARRGLPSWPHRNLRFFEASAESLPFDKEAFDLVISNGALNLVADKDAAFRQVRRLLRPGGRFVAADLLIDEAVPEEVLARQDAWSS